MDLSGGVTCRYRGLVAGMTLESFFFFLATLLGLWDLSSLTKD